MNLALHMSDGLLSPVISVACFGLAAAAITVAAVRARDELDDRAAPMAGLLAAFVFAAQMINIPVFPGVSGHLVGGALAALLVGLWPAVLCMATVVIVQAVLFADGGLTALGPNLLAMAVVSPAAGYGVARLLHGRAGPAVLGFAAGCAGVLAAALTVSALLIAGGPDGVASGAILGAIAGLHVPVALGEGVITALTVRMVARTRPDLVHTLAPSQGAPA